MITIEHIKNLDPSKIYSIREQVGNLATLTKAKYYKSLFSGKAIYYVATREGILKFMGCAQKACIYGVKNKHYKEFKTPQALYNYLVKIN